jgi:hypothetical protein
VIRSHWENNYTGSVKTLNMISERLAAAMKDPELPPIVYGGLKLRKCRGEVRRRVQEECELGSGR